MQITVIVTDRGTPRETVIESGEKAADALARIGYPWQDQHCWRVWREGGEITLETVLTGHCTITLSHVAAGDLVTS